ncbi:phage tail sheath subtilisin-like domain-containing protein [bacterium]|nr:phage tail sheath subtilisin-like domain-containing protein [bacterium]
MAEKIVSPGVFTNEVDQSFLPAGVAAIGAAVIGPTAKGPALVPTTVSSYSEFVNIFGGVFESGSGAGKDRFKYLTNYSAQEYLKYADTLTVVRILDGAFSPATATIQNAVSTGVTFGSGSVTILSNAESEAIKVTKPDSSVVTFIGQANPSTDASDDSIRFFDRGASTTAYATNFKNEFNAVNGLSAFTAANVAGKIIISGSSAGTSGNSLIFATGSGGTFTTQFTTQGGTNSTTAENVFTLTTLSHGDDQTSQNTGDTLGTNELLPSGSENNLRYEVSNVNSTKGSFNLTIRRGDDTKKRKIVLEQYNGVNLDPNSTNYIARRIGDQVLAVQDVAGSDPFIQYTGDYPNRSKLVRVTAHKRTVNYLDENGDIRDAAFSAALPIAVSGGFAGGSDGDVKHPRAMYENIADTNSQGIEFTAAGQSEYIGAIRLLKNQDEYDINLLSLPGVVDNHPNHAPVITEAINMVESRGDCFLVIDPVKAKTTELADVVAKADGRDTNYAAVYWPWIKIPDNDLGKNVWVPASTVIPSVYAFNDRVAAPWFAPAGLNRGGIDIAVQAERKLTHANRDTLYESNVNPIATFPNAGVTVFGQKTLQKKASALDRVNVRRLLIAAKKFIASSTKFLVFENNTAATRNRFLSIVNPYFENIQQRQGLYAFKVVMDESNNTPDVIDRNEMQGQIFMQPAKTAEFIVVDFNIMATGASFPE